jgi:membrane fusion protein, multidrug efflux system
MPFLQKLGPRRPTGIGRIIVALVLLAAAAIAVRQHSGTVTPPAAQAPAAVPVTAAMAVRKDVPHVIDTIGIVQSIDSIAVQSQVSGPIVKIEFQPGQDVKKDQELFLIDPRPYQAAFDQQQAQLKHDEAVLGEAQMDLKRYQNLAKEQAIQAQQAEDQAYVVQQDEGTVAVDHANVETATINLNYCHIKSSIDGRAGVLNVDLGNLVGPSTGSAATSSNSASRTGSTPTSAAGQTGTGSGLVSITQMKPIYVSFPIAQTLAGEVRRAQAAKGPLEVQAYSQAGEKLGDGKLTVIDNQVNTGTGTLTMQATFANEDEALWPGEFVSVQLVVSMRRNVVTVPAEAVMEGASGSYVYVIGPDRKVRRVDVQVAARQQGIDVIAKGVSAGEEVVTDGQYRLDNGVKVNVQKAAAKVAQQ